ncbi:unnamed protein product [Ophioblennius macclurei]
MSAGEEPFQTPPEAESQSAPTQREGSRPRKQRMTPAVMEENQPESQTEPVPRPRSKFLSISRRSDSNNNTADSSDATFTTQNASGSESNEDQTGHPVRPPPRPPAPSAESVKRNSIYGRLNPAVKPSTSSVTATTLTASSSETSFSSIYEDLDELQTILTEENQPDVHVGDSSDPTVTSENATSSESKEDQVAGHPVRPPRRPPAPSAESVKRNSIYGRLTPTVKTVLMEENQPEVHTQYFPHNSTINNNTTFDSSDPTDNASNSEDQTDPRGLYRIRPPPRPPAPSAEAVTRNSLYGRLNSYPSVKPPEPSGTNRTTTLTANSSEESFSSIYGDLEPKVTDQNQADDAYKADVADATENGATDRLDPPVRPPPRPPAPSPEAVTRNSFYGRSNAAIKPQARSVKLRPQRPERPDRPFPPQRPPLPPLYCDRLRLETTLQPENDTDASQQSRSSSTSSVEQAIDHSHIYEDTLDFIGYPQDTYNANVPTSPPAAPELQQPDVFDSPSGRELSPTQQRPPTPPSFSPLLLLPSASTDPTYSEIPSPIYVEILPDESEEMHITSLLRWLRKMSKTDCMAPSLYGLSIDEELRSFNQRAVNVTKALRLYNHLMIKRKDNLKNIISEFRSICGTLDKIQKKNKTMSIAGGTTGAVGGMTAVMGIALAPATIGASLVATLVGAGMVASAGAMGAHAAKANKKIVDRTTVEKLLYDYKANVVDLELCLHFILVGMNEQRRHDIARLHRAGAEPDAVKMAHRSEAVYRYNTKNSRATSTPNTSEKLLLAFVKEMDQYFTDRDVTLRKSTKSKFSGRVCLLAENLQDELDYLNDMWGIFSS